MSALLSSESTSSPSALSSLLNFLKRPHGWLTLLLTLFALWIRLRHLGYTEFWIDQSATLSIALRWIHGGPFPLTADLSSAGTHNPPLIEYLYAIPLFIKDDILGVPWLLAIVNLLGILAAGLATARVFGWRVAWWASLLFVVNPWGVFHGRLIWMPSFAPAFSAMLFACVLLYFTVDARPRYLILAGLCLSATLQAHLTGFALIAVLGLMAIIFFRRLKAWPLVVGAVLFLLSLAPFILFQIQTRFADLENARARLNDFSATNLAPVLLVFDLLHSAGIYVTLGRAADLWRSQDLLWLRADEIASALLVGALISALASALALRRGHEPKAAGALLLLCWIIVPAPLYIRHSHYLYTYYFLYLLPALCALLALFGDRLYCWLVQWLQHRASLNVGRASRTLALVAFLPLALVAFQQGRLAIIGQNLLVEGASGHRRILDVRRAITVARELLSARPDCQLVILEADPFYDFRALITEATDPRRARFAEIGQTYLYPDPCAVYLSTTDRAEVKDWLNTVARPLPGDTIHTPEETWTFYDLPAGARATAVAGLKTDSPLGVWENGAQLNRFHFEPAADGSSLSLVYTWQIRSLPDDAAARSRLLQVGNYLLDSRNALVSQVDGVGRDSLDWREGDIFQTVWRLPIPPDLPPGEYSIATAFYLFPESRRIPLADGRGDLLVVEHLPLPTR